MGMFTSLKLDSFEDLFLIQIKDLYDAEQRLIAALPKMAEAAHSPELKRAFEMHLEETRDQARRLEQIFNLLGESPERQTCEAMKGLVEEGADIIKAKGEDEIRDAALIAAAQRIEHYEISGYGSARTFAQRLGLSDAVRLLQETLDEEGNTDKILTHIAEESVNVQAQRA